MGNHVAKIQPAGVGTKNPVPNFRLVGGPYGTPTTIGTLLRYARVAAVGRNRWYVEARSPEWVAGRGHTVWTTRGGSLRCDCRQGVAGRECEHALTVRHFGSTQPPRAGDRRQLRLVEDPEPPVRVSTPRSSLPKRLEGVAVADLREMEDGGTARAAAGIPASRRFRVGTRKPYRGRSVTNPPCSRATSIRSTVSATRRSWTTDPVCASIRTRTGLRRTS